VKRLRIRLIREFKEADKFKYRGLKFKYDDLYSVWLSWRMEGRRIELRHISGTNLMYRKDYSDVPINILRASIKFLNERIKYEKAKRKVD
jgi:hypothetical protein